MMMIMMMTTTMTFCMKFWYLVGDKWFGMTISMLISYWIKLRWMDCLTVSPLRNESPSKKWYSIRMRQADWKQNSHYNDVIMSAMASQFTSLTIVYSTVYSGADQRKHQSPASLAFVPGIHRWPVNSPHKWPVMRKIFPFDDVIMSLINSWPEYRITMFKSTLGHNRCYYSQDILMA